MLLKRSPQSTQGPPAPWGDTPSNPPEHRSFGDPPTFTTLLKQLFGEGPATLEPRCLTTEGSVSDSKLAASVAARGGNLVLLAPPSPALAKPVLAGLLGRGEDGSRGRYLGLAPAEAVNEWARVAAGIPLVGTRAAGTSTPARLSRLLHSETLDLLFASPETAHELVRRAALKPSELRGVLLLWPESWAESDLAAELLQDLDKSAQRILVSSDPGFAAPLIERYTWRAPVVDLLGVEPPEAPPPPVRSMPVAWSRRVDAIRDLIEQLDPSSLAVYVADPAERERIAPLVAGAGAIATISSEMPETAGLVVAYDLPSPETLRVLAGAGDVVLLTPSGTEAYVTRLAPNRRPLHPTGGLEAARSGRARDQRTITARLEQGPSRDSFLALGPLLERFEATAVAAALHDLWQQSRASAQAEPARASEARPPMGASLWVGIGKRDAVTPADLVAALIKDVGVPRQAIGKLDIRESFSLIQLGPEVAAQDVAERLTGKTIKGRRLVARLDKGRPARGPRPPRERDR